MLNKTLLWCVSIIFCISLFSCENFSWLPKDKKKVAGKKEKVVNGLDKKYYPNGKLYAEIEKKDGVRHGLSKSYYRSGALYLELTYALGQKEGASKVYWESGKLRRTTPYKNGGKHGVRKSYFTNGQLSSTITYNNDHPSTDLKEYFLSGSEVSQYPVLKYDIIDQLNTDDTFTIKFYFTKGNEGAEFFAGELVDGKFFDENLLTPIPDGAMSIILEKGYFINKKILIVGRVKTKKHNPYIRTLVYDLAIEH